VQSLWSSSTSTPAGSAPKGGRLRHRGRHGLRRGRRAGRCQDPVHPGERCTFAINASGRQFSTPRRLPIGRTSSSAQPLPMAQNDALCAKAGCKSILTRTMHIERLFVRLSRRGAFSFPLPGIVGSPGGRVKDAPSGAAARPGCARSWTACPLARVGSSAGKGRSGICRGGRWRRRLAGGPGVAFPKSRRLGM